MKLVVLLASLCLSHGQQCTPKFSASSLSISASGAEETVWSYKNSHAEPNNLPDFHPVAYRTADSNVHLQIVHFENYRISGNSLSSLSSTPQKTFDSDQVHSAAWGDFGHHQWIASPYTDDGTTFYALAHSEWYACLQYGNDPVKGCSVKDNQLTSWVNGITMFQSRDGGASWNPLGGNGAAHVVLAPSMSYPSDWKFWELSSSTLRNYGFFHPSNIKKEGSYYYATVLYIHRTSANIVDPCGTLLIRTQSLADTKGWTVWDGSSYIEISTTWDTKLPILSGTPSVNQAQMSTITWSETVCQYIIMFTGDSTQFMTTPSLASPQLSQLRSIAGISQLNGANYPILQDPTFTGFNLHAVGDTAYVYSVRQNGGLDRDVVRTEVVMSGSPSPPGPPTPPTPSPPGPPTPPTTTHPIYRCHDGQGRHLTSSSAGCEGLVSDGKLCSLADSEVPGTTPLYRCSANGDHMLSVSASCEGYTQEGSIGYIWSSKGGVGNVALYRCYGGGFHMTSISPNCEGSGPGDLYGYCTTHSLNPFINESHTLVV